MQGEKRKLLEEAKALGMGLSRLRALPVSEIRRKIEVRKMRAVRTERQPIK